MFNDGEITKILENEIEKRSFLNNNYLKTTYLWSFQDSFAGKYDEINIKISYKFQLKGMPEQYHYSFSIKPGINQMYYDLAIELQRNIIKSFGRFIGYLHDRFGVVSIGVYKTAMNILENDPTVISDPYLDNLFEHFPNVDTTTQDIYSQFLRLRKAEISVKTILDYRPYDLMGNTIAIFFEDSSTLLYTYQEEE